MARHGSYQDVLAVLKQATKPMTVADLEAALGLDVELLCNIMWRMYKVGKVPGLTRSGRSGEGKSGNGYKYYIFKDSEPIEVTDTSRYSTWCREFATDITQTQQTLNRY